MVRELLSFIPSNNLEDAPRTNPTDSPERPEAKLNTIVPEASNQPYDIREVIQAIEQLADIPFRSNATSRRRLSARDKGDEYQVHQQTRLHQ